MPDETGTILEKGHEFIIWVGADDEFDCVNGWIDDLLSNDSIIAGIVDDRVFQGQPPEGVDLPLIRYGFMSADDDDLTYGDGPVARLNYLVTLVDQWPTYDRITPGYVRIKALMHNAEASRPDGEIPSCQRRRPHIAEYPNE
jgi:hypothetical protein